VSSRLGDDAGAGACAGAGALGTPLGIATT
jgi:hypothetical protein